MRDPDAMVSDGVDYVTRINLYNLNFWMVVLIKKLYPGREFNFCHHPPTSSISGHFIYIPHNPQESELYELVYTNSYIGSARCTLKVGAAGCTLKVGAAGCTLTVGAASDTNCTP